VLIRDCRPWGGESADVRIEDGRIVAVEAPRPIAAAADSQDVVDGRGRLLLPTFADVHVHVDSTRLGLPFRPHTGAPGVWAMMLNDRRNWRHAEATIVERTTSTLATMIAHGTTLVRTFAQVDADCRLERLEAVFAAREAHQQRAEVQVIAFPQAGLLREDGSIDVLEDALRAGVDVVGGIDPCALDRDPVRHLDVVFSLAERYQKPIDIHLHEPGELGAFSADLIVERTRALGMQGNVLISHGYGLWRTSEAQTNRLVEAFADADIATATVAPGAGQNLPLTQLAAAGVRVGLGEDGQRDYWTPYGNGDLLDRTWQLTFAHGFRADELIEHCVAIATAGGASIMDHDRPRLTATTDRPGLGVGDPGHVNLIAGETVTAAVMDRLADRTVIYAGRVVADALALV